MRGSSLRLAHWHRHVAAVGADALMRDWLTTPGSLTARLVSASSAFRVQRLQQRIALCGPDEAAPIALPRRQQVHARDVLLHCDGVPIVFGHTVVPLTATATDWPLFSALGERSLGTTLFYDPLVQRGPLAFARLRDGHPLIAQLRTALGERAASLPDGHVFHARRCVYRRHQGLLMVTEVFLPTVRGLAGATHTS